MNCMRHEPNIAGSAYFAAACPEMSSTSLQDIAYSSDRSFADQRRSEGSNLDWELEVRFSHHCCRPCIRVASRGNG